MNVTLSAIMPPVTTYKPLVRKKIHELLPEIDKARVTNVSAPAGYGKTQAMLYWADALELTGRPVMWLAGRSGLGDRDTLQETLRAAAIAKGIRIDGEGIESLLCGFANRGDALPVLVIDDTQFLSDDAGEFLGELIGRARDTLTTIVASRGKSRLPLARLRSLGYLLDVGVDELRFQSDEIAEVVRLRAQGHPAAEWIELIEKSLSGWPAGTMLAAHLPVPLQPSDGESEIEAVKLSYRLREFFEEEVLSELSEETIRFLESIAIFPGHFDRNDAALVTSRADTGTILARLVDEGVFLEGSLLSRDMYVVQPVFRSILFNRAADRDLEWMRGLLQAAASHFLATNRPIEALEMAQKSRDQSLQARA